MPAAGQPKKRGRGQPTCFDAEKARAILSAIHAGNYVETAAAYAGIAKSTLYLWLRKGRREKEGEFRQFSDAVEKALAAAEVRDVATITKASAENWQAAAWRLERKHPDRWGRRIEATMIQKAIKEVAAIPEKDVLVEMGYEPDHSGVG